ncbi:MAG: GNAT family N-acetyltransferase [Eubacteriaceae bacterium]|nr:GNAT family N-acetyltransferase [Eubacteriaceae bacterium]
MDKINLVFPAASHKEGAEELKSEFFANNEQIIHGSGLYDRFEFDPWLEIATKRRNGIKFSDDWGSYHPSTCFFAIRESDGYIVGMADVRHLLANHFLKNYGGHIGYSVRPSERRKGYATQMLGEALKYAASIGLGKVMVSCYEDNIGSVKTILNCGGVLSESKLFADGKPMNVYWVDTQTSKS